MYCSFLELVIIRMILNHVTHIACLQACSYFVYESQPKIQPLPLDPHVNIIYMIGQV